MTERREVEEPLPPWEGGAGGIFGGGTAAALTQFQTDQTIEPASGVADAETLRQIDATLASRTS